MAIERIYIVRHGFRLNWLTTKWIWVISEVLISIRTSRTGVPRDPPLAALGETQAQETAKYFSSVPDDKKPTAVFSSPYYRCLQTAEPSAVALNVPLYVEHGISEWYSPVTPGTGLHPRPTDARSLRAYFSAIDTAWSPSTLLPSRKGETVEEVHNRTGVFLNTFLKRAEALGHRSIMLVTHAATAITLVRVLAEQLDLPLRVGCCTISIMEPEPETRSSGAGKWKALMLASGDHLASGSQRDWGFEDVEIANGQVVNDPGVPGTEDEVETPDLVGLQLYETSASLSRSRM